MRLVLVSTICAVVGVSACERASDTSKQSATAPSVTSTTTSLSVKQVMGWIVDPNASIVFAAVGVNVTKNGEEKFQPRTDAQWNVVRNSAATVLESANLLNIGNRARDQDEWPRRVTAFSAAAEKVLQAIDVKDADELFAASGDLYEACTECHAKYIFGENAKPAK